MEDESNLFKLRHSTAHLLAQAVKELYPNVQLGIGPVIDNGFYYDFLRKEPFTPEDLKVIKEKMKEISKKKFPIEKTKLKENEIIEYLEKESLKKELFNDLKEKGEEASFYSQGDFVDLCRGPHVENTKDIKYFELTKVSGAYWKADSKNVQLQRIYGIAFETKEELKAHLTMMENAEKFNHRKIGEEMELFTHFDKIGKGLIVWLPKGEIIKNEVETLAKELEARDGYVRVSTPILAKKELFEQSGHLPYYADSMYPPMKLDDGDYYLKAMNCPLHHLIFSRKVRSYRELPLRIAEYGTVHRNELSGTLNGLQRVRGMCMNDAHIYCTKDQMEEEIESVLKLIKEYFEIFGFKDYWFRLSLGDPNNKEKFIDEPENWKFAEEVLRKILKKTGIKFIEAEGEAAFYGPKIDVQFRNIYGKEDTMSTNQLDFVAKSRFSLHYDDKEGKQNEDVFVIHRAPLSTHERFIAFLIEHYAGKFPLWLSPVQVRIMTVTDRNNDFAKDFVRKLKSHGIRADLDMRNESIGKKVRDGIKQKVNYLLTLGDNEMENKTISARGRDGNVEKDIPIDKFIEKLEKEIKERKC
ncbi:MAG: threonine--tRNA ligase [Nanoarchaeota archaeon]|nr:threonine--tRNA ligase [Nanoarchaeota archaeon]